MQAPETPQAMGDLARNAPPAPRPGPSPAGRPPAASAGAGPPQTGKQDELEEGEAAAPLISPVLRLSNMVWPPFPKSFTALRSLMSESVNPPAVKQGALQNCVYTNVLFL